ncbi:MAG TPA: hypothetical protein VK104_10755 [Burkholderiaceae bacterium]|nr:hypothetical protein [Burkholderiaceae bacterium]
MKPALIVLSLFAGLLTWWLSPRYRQTDGSPLQAMIRRIIDSAVVGIAVYVVLMLSALLWLWLAGGRAS